MRFLTAGESHGESLVSIIEGFPKGVRIKSTFINSELSRRMAGYGRGKRMKLERDKVHIVAGLRNGITLGSPICMILKNKDNTIYAQKHDVLKHLTVPRPGHADLAGCFKYGEGDLRNILERSSARETATRVCLGGVCKQFLSVFGIRIRSFTSSVGDVISFSNPKDIGEIIRKSRASKLNCIDRTKEPAMIKAIDKAASAGDTLGGTVQVWAENVPAGLGSCMHFDRRLDARIAGYVMSIPSVKAVALGAGFAYTRASGRCSHDAIYYSKNKKFYRKTNNSGGVEGGISNGETITVSLGAKPIPTLLEPLDSVDIITKRAKKAVVQRSDVCVVAALGVVAESMLSLVLTESFLDKFGTDTLDEIKENYKQYIKRAR